ncbi:MAG: DUF4804 domain-containing protein [Gammaproteobacteria bacterium]|nr:DUF4804 domain-containing protein [Gammaproteobacteria bacterium]
MQSDREPNQQDTVVRSEADYKAAFKQLAERSQDFLKKADIGAPPTTENRISTLVETGRTTAQEIVEAAESARTIVDPKVIELIKDFLAYKKEHGTEKEKELYEKMTPEAFIERLLTKRPVVFMGDTDDYILRNGERGSGGFEKIGTDQEVPPLVLADYISYEEMEISALLSVSEKTFFINRGDRGNHGVPGEEGSYEKRGFYIGQVGARFEKPGVMEWKYCVITEEQNTREKGYGAPTRRRKVIACR